MTEAGSLRVTRLEGTGRSMSVRQTVPAMIAADVRLDQAGAVTVTVTTTLQGQEAVARVDWGLTLRSLPLTVPRDGVAHECAQLRIRQLHRFPHGQRSR